MRLAILTVALLAGCAASPEQMAQQSDWNVCRFTMGGPHSQVAEQERYRRGLDCTPYYGPIAAKQQADNAALQNLQRALNPPRPAYQAPQIPQQTQCRTVLSGNVAHTQCY